MYALPDMFTSPPTEIPPTTINAFGVLNPTLVKVDPTYTEELETVRIFDQLRTFVIVDPVNTLPSREGCPRSGSAWLGSK